MQCLGLSAGSFCSGRFWFGVDLGKRCIRGLRSGEGKKLFLDVVVCNTSNENAMFVDCTLNCEVFF